MMKGRMARRPTGQSTDQFPTIAVARAMPEAALAQLTEAERAVPAAPRTLRARAAVELQLQQQAAAAPEELPPPKAEREQNSLFKQGEQAEK